MRQHRGFTLIETLITTLVLVTGLAAIAGLFSYGAETSSKNRQRTAAAALLYSKTEELRNALDLVPGQYTEYLSIQADGSIAPGNNTNSPYLRVSKIEAGSPKRVTVIVYAPQRTRKGAYLELVRATVLVAQGF